ncbi:MAG: class I adenylate-forming enzyme family protein [Candidatus Sericytochromatia bacterium]
MIIFNTLDQILENLNNKKYSNYIINDGLESISFFDFFSRVKENISSIKVSSKRFFIKANNDIFFIESLFSIIFSGNIAIPINPEFTKEKIDFLKEKFNIDYIIYDSFPKINENNNDFKISSETPALAIFTSGTTGEAKAVLMSHKNILFNAYSVIKTMNISNPENIGIILPLYHSFALITQLITSFITGANIYLLPKTNNYKDFSDFIIKNKINTMAGVPTNFKMLLFGENKEYPNVKHITIAGASLDKKLAEKIHKSFFNSEIWVGYGLTEAGPRVTAINYNDPKFHNGSVGKSINGVEIIVKDNDILINSKSNMICYLDDKDSTDKKIIDSYLYSGDTGYIDEDGYLYITGRKDDIFISSGEKISPLIIEKVLNYHPNIVNSAIFGEYDDILGKRIIAVVKLKDESIIKAKDLLLHCSNLLEKHQIPHKFFKTNELPMTPNGKIMRRELPKCQKEKI